MSHSHASQILSFYKSLSEEKRIIFLYRYFSLCITSTAYFISSTNHSIENRFLIIACIIIASIILNYLYLLNYKSEFAIKVLVFIETIGNSILLIPSGGLESPYVLLALNTIIITSLILSQIYCWITLFIYLSCSTFLAYLLFNNGNISFSNLLYSESYLIVSSILMIIAIRLLSRYIKCIQGERKKLMEINSQLVEANNNVKESIKHIMELYQAVHLFSNTRNKTELIELILENTKKIIETDMIVFFSYEKQQIVSTVFDNEYHRMPVALKDNVIEIWDSIVDENSAIELIVEDSCYLVISVKSSYMTYGVLGLELSPNQKRFIQIEKMDQIKFFADLSSIVLEKFELEKVNNKLLITEEQNRIANEIHDSVLQRLFSTSFAIYGLMKKLNKANIKDADADLAIIRESIDHAMKELRTTIYGLSWKKDGSDNFLDDIANYVYNIKVMNNIDINLNIIGNSEFITYICKKVIYRIICEGIGNAVRHGKATHIEITLNIKDDATQLRIVDDGIGFNFESVSKSKQVGLGIKNISTLVESLKGQVDFQSKLCEGTAIKLTIPNHVNDNMEDQVV
ncbi:MAG: ATP-binding protein [Lutisporaceae bacterium]